MTSRPDLSSDESRATLPDGALGPLLGRLHRGRASGWLRLTGMEIRGGIPTVVRMAFKLQEARVVAVDATEDPLRPLPSSIDIAERATAALLRVLGSRAVVHGWTPVTETSVLDPAAPLLAAVGLRAMERLPDAAAVHVALGPLDRALATCPPSEAALAALTGAQRILITRVRPTLTAETLIASADDIEGSARDLLALLCAGAVEWMEPAVPTAPGPGATSTASTPRPPSPPAPPPVIPPAAPPAPASVERPRTGASQAYRAVAEPPPKPPDGGALRREIEEAHAALRGSNHFTVLGLGPTATSDEVRQAFTRLARRYHPDAQRDPALHDLGARLTELFVAISDAYSVLKDSIARERYERALAARVAAESAAAARRSSAPAASRMDDSVEGRVLRAEEALAAGQPWETIRLIEETLPALFGALKVRGQVLLARGYANRGRPRESERVLLDLLQAEPACLPACLILAGIYRARGMAKRAQGLYERALEIDPRHAEARRELAALAGEAPDPAPPGPGSFLSRLRDRR